MSWHTVTTRFEVVKQRATKNLPCPVCGKKARRERTFEGTINPYNRNASGQVKTRPEVQADLQALARVWQQQPEAHQKCLDGAA